MPSCFLASGLVRTRPKIMSAQCAIDRPDLLPVDDVVVAVAHGARLEAGEIGAGTGLGVALAPRVVPEDARQEALLLLGVPKV